MKLWQRALVAVLLLSALGGLFVHSEVTSEARSPYPEPHELAADYDSYVGETILVFGQVTDATGDELTIESESEGVNIELQVTNGGATVEPGGVVQVYGELQLNRTMAAQQIVVVNESGGSAWHKYAVSAIGALGFLVAFGRYWRVDTETWTVEGRDG